MSQTARKVDGNMLCRKCLRPCRQAAAVRVIDCPRYLPRPFAVEANRYAQLELFEPEGHQP